MWRSILISARRIRCDLQNVKQLHSGAYSALPTRRGSASFPMFPFSFQFPPFSFQFIWLRGQSAPCAPPFGYALETDSRDSFYLLISQNFLPNFVCPRRQYAPCTPPMATPLETDPRDSSTQKIFPQTSPNVIVFDRILIKPKSTFCNKMRPNRLSYFGHGQLDEMESNGLKGNSKRSNSKGVVHRRLRVTTWKKIILS